jgi:TPR repeat protein
MKRIEANDPVAMCQMGTAKYHEGDYNSSFEYLTRAAALGDADAHYQLSCLYGEGKSVEIDAKRALHHAEKAAIGGHPIARYNLGCTEAANDRMDRAAKHWIIAAKLGDNDSLEAVKNLYKSGHVSKEDFTAALRGYQTAIIATKSPQRDAAAEFYNNR